MCVSPSPLILLRNVKPVGKEVGAACSVAGSQAVKPRNPHTQLSAGHRSFTQIPHARAAVYIPCHFVVHVLRVWCRPAFFLIPITNAIISPKTGIKQRVSTPGSAHWRTCSYSTVVLLSEPSREASGESCAVSSHPRREWRVAWDSAWSASTPASVCIVHYVERYCDAHAHHALCTMYAVRMCVAASAAAPWSP